jgi:hypothetical protein
VLDLLALLVVLDEDAGVVAAESGAWGREEACDQCMGFLATRRDESTVSPSQLESAETPPEGRVMVVLK